MQNDDSLRDRLVQPFVLLGFIVSAVLSLSTFALLAQIEERAILRALHVELESFRHRSAINPDASPVAASLLRGYYLPSERIPGIKAAPSGEDREEMRTLADGDFSVLVSDVHGRPFALIYDRAYIKSNLEHLALVLLVATGLMTGLSFLVGYRLSRKVIRPIVRLLGEVSVRASQPRLPDLVSRFLADGYARDEIGLLVQELDRYSLRLHGFIQRESHFAADVSHELRTPISVIRSAAEILADTPGLPESVLHRIFNIERQAVRMSQMLEAMLLLGREESTDEDPACGVTEVVEEVVEDARHAIQGRPVSIVTEFVAHPILPAERALVYVVISNVMRNACAYTREGLITLRLHEDRLEVADSGIGIPGERFPELFRRHSRGQDSTGFGLGLSIVARICERLCWQVEVDSAPGLGTMVTLRFP